ncbi:isochorismate synthase [[Actinobacillus] muris]|uniref:Isochorismate synthase MenF n=1 Tax=Muribacter muris TaxID=67855 RepID=A0A0J5P2Z2_9PAST|nr:isochorismate synthase [Muribacter muris]KMK50858.1 isochorismate synthase [[Actinobacillus] muris] [Muribacter muris]
MSIFHQLKQQLSQQIQHLADTAEWSELTAEIALPDETPNVLAWLKGQTHFPQYFWQSRDEDNTLVALGAARRFECLDDAQAFSERYGYRLVGGLTFEKACRFILPRLLFVKNVRKLTAYCYLNGQERQQVSQFLHQIAPMTTLTKTAGSEPLARQQAATFSDWAANIERAIHTIQTSELNKVVLANATTLTFTKPVCPYDLLFASQQKNLGCYHFLWSENGEQTFIGSSPERLYRRQGRYFYTEALAGTAAVTADVEQTECNALWLLNDPKNRYENWLVVDDICSHLTDCAADIQVGEAEIKRLKNVQHLRRFIQTQLADKVKDGDCLARIHPTAAVAGLPRPLATEFIRRHEQFQRGWYAGTLGYFTPENAEFCVALRSALIEKNHITLYAGAGIVEGSKPDDEWQEIERKSLAIANLLTVER